MKAVVVELKNDLAAVLSDDGYVTTVKNSNYEIGQIIQINTTSIQFYKKIRILAASAAAVLVLFGTGVWAYASPYTYVSMDVNPSIKFTINRFDRVLKVEAANNDGEKILDKISIYDLKNKTIESALSTSVDEITDAGYFDGASRGGIVIATSSKNTEKAKELAKELQQTIKEETVKNGDDVEVEAFSVNAERRKEAEKLGVTPGKLNLVRKLQKAASDTETIDTEEWLNKPVKDIMKATKDYKDAAKKKQNSTSDTALEDATGKGSKNNGSVQNSEDKKTSVENKSKQETSQASVDTKVTTKQKSKSADTSKGSTKTKVNNSKKDSSKTTSKTSDKKESTTGSSKKTSNKSSKKSTKKSSSQTGQTSTDVKDTASGNSQASGNNTEDKSQSSDSKNQDVSPNASDKSGGNSQSSDNKSGSGSKTADGKTDSGSQSKSSNDNSSHSNK